MPAINTQELTKYGSYTNEQIAAEFLTSKRNDGSYVVPRAFVPDVLGSFLADEDKDGKTYTYSLVKKSIPLIHAIYNLYVTNCGTCDYALNLKAITTVLEKFARSNSRTISDRDLAQHFENFFAPLLKNAYVYRNNNQLSL